jgi:hypothetical protein
MKKTQAHKHESTSADDFSVHPDWKLLAEKTCKDRLMKLNTRSDVEALLTGKLMLTPGRKAVLVNKLSRVLEGPPNDPKVGTALINIIDSGDYLAVAGNYDEFFRKVFGWDACQRTRHGHLSCWPVGRVGRSKLLSR